MALEAEQAVCENTTRVVLRNNGRALSFVDVIDLWRGDKWFSGFFVETLAACRYRCFRFETPPAMSGTLDRPFEFVLVDSPEIDLAADPRDFQAHFDACADDVLVFDNLGGDATMIVPRPLSGVPGYAHIAGFTRNAPVGQQLSLWQAVGDTLGSKLDHRPLWLNTAGGGVPWLHVRIDTRPKYYVYGPYRTWKD